jgi:hypothetical protein
MAAQDVMAAIGFTVSVSNHEASHDRGADHFMVRQAHHEVVCQTGITVIRPDEVILPPPRTD